MATPRFGRRRERGSLAAVARLLNEVRYPTTRRAKIIVGILAVVLFTFFGLVAVGGFFLARALQPSQAGETIDPTRILGTAQSLEFQGLDGETRSGWFFPGLRGAPAIVLCHGYRSNRTEVLTLATSLQQHRYNVFAFNLAGHGESPVGYTTLGYQETEELVAALEMLSTRDDVDTQRLGVWGYSLGAYAALNAAAQIPAVKVVVVDSVYPDPTAMLRLVLQRLGAQAVPLISSIVTAEFQVVSLWHRGQPRLEDSVARLAGVQKLFIAGDDNPALARTTQSLYEQAPGPKELVVLPRSNMRLLVAEERDSYHNLIVTYFLRTLPLVAPRS